MWLILIHFFFFNLLLLALFDTLLEGEKGFRITASQLLTNRNNVIYNYL